MSSTLESPSRAVESVDVPAGREARALVIALAGNPNAGKTSIFNALTGLRQKVANYPGVTVERKEGVWTLAPDLPPASLIDLPGLYSLDAASIDEQIARDVLAGSMIDTSAPDVIIAVVDATNLERNLYLVTQILEMGRPVVVALTMVDLAERAELVINVEKMSESLGVRVVPVTAKHSRGLDDLARAVLEAVGTEGPGAQWRLSSQAEEEVMRLTSEAWPRRAEAMRDLYADELPMDALRRETVGLARERLARSNPQWWQEPVTARYRWIESVAGGATPGGRDERPSATEKIDRLV
ncbi:MAG: 50S ribosome-binding GTPase, partial [Rubrivivax sp.]|nr:50S ribosome-binding GTPase [Pyrinomonadaceae bacterium]